MRRISRTETGWSNEEVEEEPFIPTVAWKSADGSSMFMAPAWTPLSRDTVGAPGPEWEPMGYLSDDGLREPQLRTATAQLEAVQDLVDRALVNSEQARRHSAFFKLPDTTKPAEIKLSFSMLTWNEEARDLYFGLEDAGVPLDGESRALLGQDCSNRDYHRAWQHRTEEMLAAETARHYGSFRRRYVLGLP